MMARATFSSFALALCVACFSYLTTLAQEIVTPGIGSDTNGSEQGSDQSSDQTKASGSANTAKAVSTSAAAAAIALLNEGLADLKRRDFKAALAAFEKAIAAMPDYAAAYAERGGAHIGLGANDKAVTDLTKALQLMGGTGDATERGRLHGNRGLAYLNQSKHEPAVADFDKAIELDPKLAFAYANRGMSHMQRKNYDAALRDASRAVELRPNYEFALLVRGYVQNDKQMFSEAAADFTKILRSSPTNRGAILGLRQAYQAGRQQEEPAKIKLVRLADPFCEPSCPEWLAIEGKIEAGAAETFKELVQKLDKRKLAVFVDSGGGSVSDAMEMGRLIRAKGLDVVVTRTELVGCGKDDAACKKRGQAIQGILNQQTKVGISFHGQATIKKQSVCIFPVCGQQEKILYAGADGQVGIFPGRTSDKRFPVEIEAECNAQIAHLNFEMFSRNLLAESNRNFLA